MTTPEPPTRSLRLSLDANVLARNWRHLDRMSGTARAGAAVKADAYGLGVEFAVPVLREAGVRDWFVAHWSEVEDVLAHVPAGEISVLHGPLTAQDAAFARAIGVRPVINSLMQARIWLDAGGGACDLMIDTGINRLGLPLSDVGDPLIARLEIDVLMSHLASADEDSPLNETQLRRFRSVCGAVDPRRRSLANSAGIALGADYAFDLSRPGLSLYGGIPRRELRGSIGPVAQLRAAVIQIRDIAAGETIGYNATFTAKEAMRVGVASLGYADGLLRAWGGKGAAFRSNGSMLPILGRVSMDMVVVDLSMAPGIREGDWIDFDYDLEAGSELTGLSQYELLTVLGRRFSRG